MSDDTLWTASADLTIEESVGHDLLVYDPRSDHVHCLDPRAATVYRAAQGRTVEQIAEVTGESVADVAGVLLALSDKGLVTTTMSGVARRSFMKLAATGVAVGIATLAVPSPAAAASGDITTEEPTTEEPTTEEPTTEEPG